MVPPRFNWCSERPNICTSFPPHLPPVFSPENKQKFFALLVLFCDEVNFQPPPSSKRLHGPKAPTHLFSPVHAPHFGTADWIMTISTPAPRHFSSKELSQAHYFHCSRTSSRPQRLKSGAYQRRTQMYLAGIKPTFVANLMVSVVSVFHRSAAWCADHPPSLSNEVALGVAVLAPPP